MALFRKLPIAVRNTPVDIVRHAKAAVLADLNQGQFPDGHWDMAAALEILEFIHDADWLLSRLRRAADRLILTYQPFSEGAEDGVSSRRAAGFVNDYTKPDLHALLQNAVWSIDRMQAAAARTLIVAQ